MMNPALDRSMNELMGSPAKTGDVGVELEIEGRNLPTQITGWEVKDEHSLRGANGRVVQAGEERDDTPREYVTSRPVLYKTLLPKLQTLHTALTGPGVVVNLTPRASTHVHLNFGTKTLREVLAFILVFTVCEPVLLRLCGHERNGNSFCLPSYETGDLPAFIERAIRGLKRQDLRHHWGRGKYACLNVDPMLNLGSMEVRCFPNAIDPRTINEWVGWLMNMRAMAETGEKDLSSLLDRISNETAWLQTEVFGHAPLNRLCAPAAPAELFTYGAEQAYECWRKMRPLFNHREEKYSDKPDVVPARRGVAWVDDTPQLNRIFDEELRRVALTPRARRVV